MASDLEVEEMEEEQEKCQWVKKWVQEMQPLRLYHESHSIFLDMLPARNGGCHVMYLETHMQDAGEGHFFIRKFSDWREELQKQSQGLSHSAATVHWRLWMLKHMEKVKLSNTYGICAEYLVEVFKYPGTGDHILSDSEDMNGMISLYSLV